MAERSPQAADEQSPRQGGPSGGAALVDLAALVVAHHAAVYRYGLRLCGCPTEAEDLAQQTFLIAQQKLHQLREPERVCAWLLAVVRSCFLKSIRKPRPTPGPAGEWIEQIAAPTPEVDEIDREELAAALGELPEEFRLVLVMFYFEDLSYQQIAEELEIPIGTVMSRLSRQGAFATPLDAGRDGVAPSRHLDACLRRRRGEQTERPPRRALTMSQIDRLREQIDTCRPGSNDLSLPALAELAQAAEHDRAVGMELARSQAFDRAVANAMHDAPLPEGLAERLLSAVSAASAPAEVILPRPPIGEEVRPASRRLLSRRQWLLAGGSLSLVALLAVSAWWWLRPPLRVSNDALALAVAEWSKSVETAPRNRIASLPAPFPLNTPVIGSPLSYQSFKTSQGWSGVAIAYAGAPGRKGATLFIVDSPAQFQVAPSPFTRLPAASTAMAAWQKGRLLYVLTVREDGQKLDDFIQQLRAI